MAETDPEVVLLIEKIGATSIGEIEKLIGGMQEAKNFLQSEKERIQRETARYAKLAQTASASIGGGALLASRLGEGRPNLKKLRLV